MRICIDISQIVYDTGVSRYTKELVRHLLKIDKKNDYLLFAGAWRQKNKIENYLQELKEEGLKFEAKIVFLPPKLADLVFNQLRIPVDSFIGQVDVFHASNWTTPKTKAKLVTTVHDLTPIIYPETFPASLISNFKRNLRLVGETADLVLADCQTTKNDLVKHSRLDSQSIKTVYLAAGKEFKQVKNKKKIELIKRKYGIKKGEYILSVGTQEPRKNIKRLIRTFVRLNHVKVSLVLVGKYGWGPTSPRRRHSLWRRTAGLRRVISTGFVDDKDLATLYSGAKAFIYPSLYEGFGLPILEAMQSGCPVITSNRSSMAEIAGQAGLLINPEDIEGMTGILEKVLKDGEMRKEMTKKGLVQAGRFSWEKTAKETITAYRKVVNYGDVD